MIYKYALSVGTYSPALDDDNHGPLYHPKFTSVVPNSLALLRTCREIYQYTKLLPFLLNTFNLVSIKVLPTLRLELRLTLAQLSSIKAIVFRPNNSVSNLASTWDHVSDFRYWRTSGNAPSLRGLRHVLPNVTSVKVQNSFLATCDEDEAWIPEWETKKVSTQVAKTLLLFWLEDGMKDMEVTFEPTG
jgi:hypothetical protein